MRVAMLTREFPPDVYGGAGVHVDFLARELAGRAEVRVECFGDPRPVPAGWPAPAEVVAHRTPTELAEANFSLQTVGVDLLMVDDVARRFATPDQPVDVLHSHTWYANLAGHLGRLLLAVPHVITAHSLEPLRPWKAEQLGGGYRVSCWIEKTAYEAADAIIAVSEGMRDDVLTAYPALDPARVHVVRNGIDTDRYRPVASTAALEKYGVDPDRPSVVFVGRITRQKGVAHLVRAAHGFADGVQVVLAAGAPDTPEIGAEVETLVADLAAERPGVVWIREMLAEADKVELLSHATVFACPSVYEPLGIVNLEAMGCATPVVASDVGGIPEVVVAGETGLLVHYDAADPAGFEAGLAQAVNEVVADPARAAAMGEAGRRRAVEEFGWAGIAEQTLEVYRSVARG